MNDKRSKQGPNDLYIVPWKNSGIEWSLINYVMFIRSIDLTALEPIPAHLRKTDRDDHSNISSKETSVIDGNSTLR